MAQEKYLSVFVITILIGMLSLLFYVLLKNEDYILYIILTGLAIFYIKLIGSVTKQHPKEMLFKIPEEMKDEGAQKMIEDLKEKFGNKTN